MKPRPLRFAAAVILTVAWFVSACGRGKVGPQARPAFDPAPAFWVWHRSSALKPAELETLRECGTRRLYWQAAECGWKGGRWEFAGVSPPQAAVNGIAIVPVFRIKADPAFLGTAGAADRLAAGIRAWRGGSRPTPVQIDFDCPARLLDRYADFLNQLGGQADIPEVSATALASWPDAPGFRKFAGSVRSVVPMFYDLSADAPEAVLRGQFHPMADPGVAVWMSKWADCPVPWAAGLPNFERLSVFGADGRLVGHLRGWEHDPVFYHPALRARRSDCGITRFEVVRSVVLDGCALTPGMTLVHRTCDPAVLEKLRDSSRLAGSIGVVYFTLPGPGIQAAFTPSHLTAPAGGHPPSADFTTGTDGSVTLKNPGPTDLPAGLWKLKLTARSTGTFLSGSPGGFVESSTPGGLPAELAGSLTLRFSKLPAGASITSGPIVTPGRQVDWALENPPSRP